MRTSRFHRCGAAVAAVATLGTLAACGSGGGTTAVRKPAPAAAPQIIDAATMSFLVKAENSTQHAHSAKVESTTVVGSALTVQVTGTIDWSAGLQGDLKTALKAQNPAAAAITEYRFTRDALYARFNDAYTAKLGGKHWFKYEYSELAQQGAAQAAAVNGLQNANPAQGVQLLIASGDVQKAGKERVRGVAVTHYSGTVDVSRLLAQGAGQHKGLSQEQVRQLKAELSGQGVTSDHIDLWVDSDGLPVKKTEQFDMTTGHVVSTAYYSDFGAVAAVAAPAASDTLDYAALLKRAGAGTTP